MDLKTGSCLAGRLTAAFGALWAGTLMSPPAGAAEINGRIALKGAQRYEVCVGYVGKGSDGKDLSNLCGTWINPNGGSASARCDTYKPRTSGIHWEPKSGCTYSHLYLPAGKYLVYARLGEHWYVWKWVTLANAGARESVDFTVNAGDMGTVDVTIPANARPAVVNCEPVNPDGSLPLKGADVGFWLHTRVYGDNRGETSITGLKSGRYQVTFGKKKTVVNVSPGAKIKVRFASAA